MMVLMMIMRCCAFSADLCRPDGDHSCYGDMLLEEFALNDSLPAVYVRPSVCLCMLYYDNKFNHFVLLLVLSVMKIM